MTNSEYGLLPGTGGYKTWSWRANIKLIFDGTDDEDNQDDNDDISDYCVDGIHYRLDTSNLLATVIPESDGVSNYSTISSTKITIPPVIYYKNTLFIVRNIDAYAFAYNQTIEEIVLGSNIMQIGDYAFYSNSGLKRINIPGTVSNIPGHAFQRCSSLSVLNIEAQHTELNLSYRKVYDAKHSKYEYYGTFVDCPLDSIAINRPVKYALPQLDSSVGKYDGAPFLGSTTLRSVVLGENVTSIDKYMFFNCKNLQNVCILGNNLATVDDYAFCLCENIKRLCFPEHTKSFGEQSLRGLTATPLIFLATDLDCGDKFLWQSGNSVIWAHNSELEKIKASANSNLNNLYDIDNPVIAKNEPKLKAASFTIGFGDYYFIPGASVIGVTRNYTSLTPDSRGYYSLSDLEIAQDYFIDVNYIVDAPNSTRSQRLKISTLTPAIMLSCHSSGITETSLHIRCDASSDETATWSERGILFNGIRHKCDETGYVTINELNPDTGYDFCGYAIYDDKIYYSEMKTFKTKPIDLDFQTEVGPTSISCHGIYNSGNAVIKESGCTLNGKDYQEGNVITGLEPDTEYLVSFYVKTESDYLTSISKTVRTSMIEILTLQPRCVSGTSAIALASTNIRDDETNVGFQWKKYDAPASLAPNNGYAAIYDGQIEGYIKNLQSAFYYNVRAFYKSDLGNYYYGDWVTFDPSDFSYIEPVVHTFSINEVTDCYAKVKGYALAGSDEIETQGFEYWITDERRKDIPDIVSTGRLSTEEHVTILASGQIMTAELGNLKSGTTYGCRAFVKTSSGATYGEERFFTTSGQESNIIVISEDRCEPEIEGYYTLEGRKLQQPERGINIIRYSDGTVRKVLIK